MTNKDLDNFFRDKLKDHKVPFNPNSWNNANKMLAAREARKRRFFYYKAAAFIAILLSTTFAAYHFSTTGASSNLQAENQSADIQNRRISKNTHEADKNVADSNLNDEIENDVQNTTSNKTLLSATTGGNEVSSSTRRNNISGVKKNRRTNFSQRVAETMTTSSAQNLNNLDGAGEKSNLSGKRVLAYNDLIMMNMIRNKGIETSSFNALEIDPDYTVLSNIPDLKPVVKHRLGLLAGGSFAPADQGGSNAGKISTDPHFGLTYEYLLSPSVSLEVNALYRRRSNSGIRHQENYSVYSFGRIDYSITLENERVGYLEIPVFVNWSPALKHQFKAGASVSRVLHSTTAGQFEVESPYNTDFHNAQYPLSENQEMLTSWDFGLQAGYEYEFISNLSIGARAYYGLSNVAAMESRGDAQESRNMFLSGYMKFRFANL